MDKLLHEGQVAPAVDKRLHQWQVALAADKRLHQWQVALAVDKRLPSAYFTHTAMFPANKPITTVYPTRLRPFWGKVAQLSSPWPPIYILHSRFGKVSSP